MDIRQGDAFICRNDVIFSSRLAPTHRPLRRAQLTGWVADRRYRSSGKRSGPPLLDLTKNLPLCPPRQKKDSIMPWNTHCEGIIPADMTDMTVDMPFCVFEPTRPSSTVLMSFYIIRLLPVACKLSYAQLARTHARFTARTEGWVSCSSSLTSCILFFLN